MASAEKIAKMIAVIKTVYPYYAKDGDSETLAKTWMLLLRDVSDEMVTVALTKCLQTCKMPPTPADILEQVRELALINEPSDEEMWVTLTKAVRKSQEHIYNFGHTFIEDNGKTQGENAREKFQKVWDELPEKLKTYLGGTSELRRLAGFNDEEMMFEKKNFLKTMPTISKRQEYKDLSLLVSGNNNRMLKDGQD